MQRRCRIVLIMRYSQSFCGILLLYTHPALLFEKLVGIRLTSLLYKALKASTHFLCFYLVEMGSPILSYLTTIGTEAASLHPVAARQPLKAPSR